jgi:uncharacterized protein with ParB-like and HNH nuclease domain
MSQFQDTTIKHIILELNRSYFIPNLQREYVWLNNPAEHKVEQLFDSLLRGYPISSFLIWKLKKSDLDHSTNKTEENLNIQLYKFVEKYDIRDTHNEKINIEQVNSNDLYIVLDGQQRLTSLYIGLIGSRTLKKKRAHWDSPNAFEERKLYINLKYIPNYEEPDDNYRFEFLTEESARIKNDTEHWFKVGNILSMESIGIMKYGQENSLSDNEIEILFRLFDSICTREKISYFTEEDKQLEKVLKIFIRVNSGGTQLSYSDLLMSILTANFTLDIREKMKDLVESLNTQGFGVLGRDQILKTCLVMIESSHRFILRNFKKTNISKIENNWNQIEQSILITINLLRDLGYAWQLSSGYIVAVIAYYYFRKGQFSSDDNKYILKFIQNAQIKAYFSTVLDRKLDILANIIRNSNSFEEIIEKLEKDKNEPLIITSDDIDRMIDLNYGNAGTFAVLQILYPNLNYKDSLFHIDHIYPKSKFSVSNKKLDPNYIGRQNELFNLQLLEGKENIEKRAKDPELWITQKFSTKDAIIKYKVDNYIDKDLSLDWENIADFEQYRNKKVIEELKNILSK